LTTIATSNERCVRKMHDKGGSSSTYRYQTNGSSGICRRIVDAVACKNISFGLDDLFSDALVLLPLHLERSVESIPPCAVSVAQHYLVQPVTCMCILSSCYFYKWRWPDLFNIILYLQFFSQFQRNKDVSSVLHGFTFLGNSTLAPRFAA